jgi:type I restriction enzyme S subunit
MSPKFRFHGYSGKWLNSTLKEISTLITKGTSPLDKSFNEEVNYIKIENINDLNGQITITSKISLQEHNGYLKRSQLQDGDLLFSIAGTLGRITLIDKSLLPANTNQALAIIRLKGVSRKFVKIALKGKIIRDFIKRNPTIGAQPNLSLEQVRNLIIHLPGEEEQNHIAYFFELFEKLTQKEQSLLEKYLELKQSYLQKIFAD